MHEGLAMIYHTKVEYNCHTTTKKKTLTENVHANPMREKLHARVLFLWEYKISFIIPDQTRASATVGLSLLSKFG